MKFFLFVFLISLEALSTSSAYFLHPPRHFEKTPKRETAAQSPNELEEIYEAGEKLYLWVEKINAGKKGAEPFYITRSSDPLPIFPIEKPIKYSAEIAKKMYAEWLKKAPASILLVMSGKKELTNQLPVPENEFRNWAQQLDFIYEIAKRWNSLKDDLYYYAQHSSSDVRGFYFLKKEKNLEGKLANWPQLNTTQQSKFKQWLIGLCFHSPLQRKDCDLELTQAIRNKKVLSFYKKYLDKGQQAWNAFFSIVKKKDYLGPHNVTSKGLQLLFKAPEDSQLSGVIKLITEEAWKVADWKMTLQFDPKARPYIKFESQTKIHVDPETWETIILDKAQSLADHRTKKSFQHEMGHILGFNDCYVEFYDEAEKVMVNYQLDTKNLMCSREGSVLPVHVETLLQTYAAP